MCGVAGIVVRPNNTIDDLQERLVRMHTAMAHRGPDDAGVYVSPDGRVGLVNRRLAIRDVSAAGHMPMENTAESVCITYNGEIYNTEEVRPELERLGYVFRSQSDTEVILHGYEAWGAEVVNRLRGMFVFGILDNRRGHPQFFMARDRLGIKPVYYTLTAEALVFASELKTLMASGLVPQEIDSAGLVGYLSLGSVPNPLTIYKGVRALEPGCSLSFDLEMLTSLPKPRRYWQMPTDTLAGVELGEAVEHVRGLMAEAVKIRLVSDVPLGAFLSGGLDSGAVVALMRKATDGPIRTCSMVFEEAQYSEASQAKLMAESVGAEHFERVITAQTVANELDKILAAMDQPSIDGINTYFVSQTARQAGLTVALSGVGGDELFGGYGSTFKGVPQMYGLLRLAQLIPGSGPLAGSLLRSSGGNRRLTRMAEALARPASLASAYLTRRGLFSAREVKELVEPDVWQTAQETFEAVTHVAERAGSETGGSRFAWVSRAELNTYTHHQLLRDTDVMSMAHSLEVRVPLLDHKLVEYVLRLPEAIKMAGEGPKPLMVKAIGDLLPEPIRNRKDKQGFEFPFTQWMRGPMKAQVQSKVMGATNVSGLRREAVRTIWNEYEAGQRHWSRVWALAALKSVEGGAGIGE